MKILTQKRKDILKLFFLCVVLWQLVGIIYVVSHEAIHQQNFNRYDLKSEVSINYKYLSGETKLLKGEDYNKCNDYCKLSHAMNDIFGYYLAVFCINLWAMLFAVLVYLIMRKNV